MTRRVRTLMRKEFIELHRSPQLLRIVIIAPIVQLTMLGYAATTDVTHVPLVVVDQDRSPASRRLIERFAGSRYFEIVADEVVIATLATMLYVTLTATVIIRNLSYLNEMGYLQKVVHAILHSLTWWAATYLLVQLVWLVAPVPNAKQIIVIIHLAKLALEIADLIEDYSDACLTATA